MKKIVLLVVTILGVIAATAPEARADYWGARWPDTDICVQNQITDRTIVEGVRAAINDYKTKTDFHMPYFGSSTCTDSYDQVVYVQAGNYGETGWVGMMVHNRQYHWGRTDNGNWTYLFDGPLYLKFNTYYNTYDTIGDWQRVAVHEIGHTLGLTHTDHTCYSVMSLCTSRPKTLVTLDTIGTNAHPGLRIIYGW